MGWKASQENQSDAVTAEDRGQNVSVKRRERPQLWTMVYTLGRALELTSRHLFDGDGGGPWISCSCGLLSSMFLSSTTHPTHTARAPFPISEPSVIWPPADNQSIQYADNQMCCRR
jgi:hypothetical protein